MITTNGKRHIKYYLAGLVPSIATSIGFGVGTTAESLTDSGLQFEVDRSDVKIVSYDFENDRLIFKSEIPSNLAGKIQETALFYGEPPSTSKLISTFDSITETWLTGATPGTYNSTNTRIGIDSLRLTPALSATSTFSTGKLLDLSENSSDDKFQLAFYNNNTNAQTVGIRFKTDNSNYYTLSVTTPAAGYIISEMLKSTAVATGTPSWKTITSIEVFVTSKAAGASSVDFEGIRIQDSVQRQDSVLISREIVTPFTKQNGLTQETEFYIKVNL